jgi:hypothetical protein
MHTIVNVGADCSRPVFSPIWRGVSLGWVDCEHDPFVRILPVMRASSKVLAALIVGLVVIGVALRVWVGTRIEAAMVDTAICLEPERRVRLESAGTPLDQRDLIVVKAAEFARPTDTSSHFGWHLKGMAIDFGFRRLWAAEQREAIFRKMLPSIRSCTKAPIRRGG